MGYQNVTGRASIKSTDPREISYIRLTIPKHAISKMEIHRRAILEPILKKYGSAWTNAVGDIDIEYDEDLLYATLTNQSDCDLDILVRIL